MNQLSLESNSNTKIYSSPILDDKPIIFKTKKNNRSENNDIKIQKKEHLQKKNKKNPHIEETPSQTLSTPVFLASVPPDEPFLQSTTEMIKEIIDFETRSTRSTHTSSSEFNRTTTPQEGTIVLETHSKQQKYSIDEQEKFVLTHLGEYIEEPYNIIESYFGYQYLERLVRHQIESYNHFINFQIQRTIQMFNHVVIHSENDYVVEHKQYFLEIHVNFDNFKLYPPQIHENNGATKIMLPQEAKLRNFTYASTMTVDLQIQYIVRNTESMDTPRIIKKTLPKINIGKMPIMIKSSICVLTQNKNINPVFTGECPMDCGGYFVVKGSEKTVLGQERAAENRVYCFDGKNTTKWNWFAEIKSVPDFKCISPKQIEMMIVSKNNGFGHGIYMSIPRIKQPIELFVVFRALGVISDKDICKHIVLDIQDIHQKDILDCLQASIIDANKFLMQEEALKHIISMAAYTPINMDRESGIIKKREFTLDILNNDLFPHCKTIKQKLYLIGYMAKKLIQTSLGMLPPDDRDSYINKRIELTGTLLNNLFRNYFNKLVKEMQKQVVREINTGSWRTVEDYENIINMTNVYKIIKSTTIENGITRALSTGDFSIKQANSSKVGVAQVLNRLTYLASLSHLRRINTPLEKSGELIAPRKLHNTTWGFLCLTGDTDVLLSNKIETIKIQDIKDGEFVNTVNRTTLVDEPSLMSHFFCKMPDKLIEITTESGRKIKATLDHPFLVRTINNKIKYEMKKAGDLNENDNVVIRHTIKNIPDLNTTQFKIIELDVSMHYYNELSQLQLINKNIPVYKLKVIARLVGVLQNVMVIKMVFDKSKNKNNKLLYNSSFYVGNEHDASQLVDDIRSLGFTIDIVPSIKKYTNNHYDTKNIIKIENDMFSYFMHIMSGNIGEIKQDFPLWLLNAELSIKREFLSAFQSSMGGIFNIERNVIYLDDIVIYTHPSYMENTIIYLNQIILLFKEFNIHCTLLKEIINETKMKLCVVFNKETVNLNTYADYIHFTYYDEKRILSAPIIELIKMKEKKLEDNLMDIVEETDIIELFTILNNKDKSFLKDNVLENGCICVPIQSIKEIKPELVYDFTTIHENHSFVASSFVVSNCPAETPEGQSIGVVKNISYMSHITIPTNSSSLYDYVQPFLQSLEDTRSEDMINKVKVFVNGAWLGITESPMELYKDIKDKKYKGIINIYTSVVFDFKLLEIRICNDGGRLSRPLLKVRDNKALITQELISKLVAKEISWNDLLTNCRIDESVIEYIDPEEQNFAMVAMKAKDGYLQGIEAKLNYTHCEIHPSTIFGILASCIPFPEHNQSPRNTYQCLDVKEVVWMADGSCKPIGEVIVGDCVLTFNPETLDITETAVVGQFVRPNDVPVYKITTVSGSQIVATEDHRFMTQNGWKTVKEMMNDSSIQIGVCNYKLNRKISTPNLKDIVPKNNTVFVKIQSITREPDGLISCIETESENHSFIAGNGFLSSNCAMSKQAIGVYAMNYDQRMDKTSYILTYPSRPLLDTRVMNFLQLNRIPSGCQIHVAIMTHTGYNQEDSVLINKGSIDRGMFTSTIYHTEKDEDKNIVRDEIIRCKPDKTKTKGIKFGNYEKLDSQGFIPENNLVENRDVIIAKIIPIKENRNDPTKTIKFEDQSKTFRTTEETYIDKNYTGRNGDGYNFAKVRTRTFRKPMYGDKFASRSAQKGTCGNIIPECDMPFTKEGLRPDIILNPHAIPSRMTIAQLKETLLGKVLLELGLFGDSTSFGNLDVKTISQKLQDLGYESYGNEIMYNGLTGEQLETSIFIGPVFYQRLKHMVNDKQHSRSIGPMVNLTRQPAEGRSRDGGFRIGEMERDVLLAHGMTNFCRERLFDVSDKYSVYVCKKCGMIAAYNDGMNKNRLYSNGNFTIHMCKTCNNTSDFARVEIPYAYKLLSQELQTINVVLRIITE